MSRSALLAGAVGMAVILGALAGCTGEEPGNAWETVESTWARHPSAQSALDAFATLISPIPGASAAAGVVPEYASGTSALRWLAPYLDELTAEQRDAVHGIVFGATGTSAAVGGAVALASTASMEQSLTQVLRVVRSNLAAWYPSLQVPEPALVVSDEPSDSTFSAVAATQTPAGFDFSPTGPLDTCVITAYGGAIDLLERVQAGSEPRWRLETPIAHELIHCAQYAAAEDVASQGEWPSWLIEGFAGWGMRMYAYRSSGTPWDSRFSGATHCGMSI